MKKTPNKHKNLYIVENNIENCKYIEIEKLEKLKESYNNFYSNKSDNKQKRTFFKDTKNFFDWYISYVEKIIPKNKVYSSKKICDNIFRKKHKNENQERDYLKSHLFISKQYVEYLKSNIKQKNIHRYKHSITNLRIDLERIITYWEFFPYNDKDKICLRSSRRKNLIPYEIYSSINDLFFIEKHNKIEDLYLRDLKPVVMFQIRQLLEIYGKNLIGYNSILDENGNQIKKFTQIAWAFIKKDVKKNDSKIEIPFDIDVIISLNKWANSFVHSTYLDNDYIQFFAINCIRDLFKQDKDGVFYNSEWHYNINYGAVKINNYESLRKDFEEYLNNKHSNTNFQIIWKELKDVGAHIIS